MLIYMFGTIITSIFMALSHFFYTKKEKNKMYILFLILSILPVSLISSLRCGVGTDYYYTYTPSFYTALYGKNYFPREYVFYNLIKFIQLFTTNAQWLFVITSFIFSIFLLLSTIRMSKNWGLSALIIVLGNYYFVSMNNVRQALAISIASLALSYACDRKIIRTILFATLSVLFHKSAVILIPIYLICMIKNIDKIGLIIIGVVLICTPLYIPLINYTAEKMDYDAYFETANSIPFYTYIYIYGLIFIILLFYYNKLIKISNYTFGLLLVFSFGVIFSLLSTQLTLESTLRMTYWFTWPLIFLIPSFTKINDNKIISSIILIMLVALLTYLTYECSFNRGMNEIYPYVDIWGHIIY